MVKLISPFLKKAALCLAAPLSMSAHLMAAPIDLVVPADEHKRYDNAALVEMLCNRIEIEPQPLVGEIPFDQDLCITGGMRHNLQLTLQQTLSFKQGDKEYDVQIVSAKMPFVRKEQIEWYVKINDAYLWFSQSRRNLQRSEQFTLNQLTYNPEQHLLSFDIQSKIYFPPSPDKKYDFIVRRYVIDLNAEKPMFWLHAMPVHQWQKWIHRGIKKELSSLFLHPATGKLVLSGDQIYGQQSRWLESELPQLPSKLMNNIHPANVKPNAEMAKEKDQKASKPAPKNP